MGAFAGQITGNTGLATIPGETGVLIRTVIAGSAGGLAAELTGGKFENGFLAAATAHLFNQERGFRGVSANEQLENGRRVQPPERVKEALERLFGESIDKVIVFESSPFTRVHRNRITTRKNRIFLPGLAKRFFSSPELVLEEYFHVLRQWNSGRMTKLNYGLSSVGGFLRGEGAHTGNRFEREAISFAHRLRDRFIGFQLGEPSR